MESNVEIRSRYDAYQDVHELYAKQGERQVMVLASMKGGLVEFCYYGLLKWEYPFHEDIFSDEDRACMAAGIADYYTSQGWRVEIDRRRPCPRCYSKLPGSDHDDWPGGTCEFCGKEIDQFGKIILTNHADEDSQDQGGFFRNLWSRLRRK